MHNNPQVSSRRGFRIALSTMLGVAIGLAAPYCAHAADSAETFPPRPNRFIVPAHAAGPTDTGARVVAKGHNNRLEQSVVAKNKHVAKKIDAEKTLATKTRAAYILLVPGG